MLEEARPGNFLQVKGNPNWWFGRSIGRPEMPYFDGIKVVVIPDKSIQLANLRAGRIDTMNLSKSQYHMVRNDPNLKIYTSPNNTTTLLGFNQNSGPAKDLRVRQAVSHAIDRRALVAGVQFGLARPASCLYPDDHWAHNSELKPVKYDPELSKRLLAEAGYENGLTMRGVNYNYTEAVTLGEAVKQMLANVGIRWEVEVLDSVAVTDRMRNLEYDLAVTASPYIQDPDASITRTYHPDGGFYFNRNHDPELIALIESGRYEIDHEKRKKIYHRIEDLLYQKYMDVWLFYDVAAIAYRKKVEGWNNKMYIENRTLYTYSHPLWFTDGKP
jgi:peptide/nickel transport system substrate-binding protein